LVATASPAAVGRHRLDNALQFGPVDRGIQPMDRVVEVGVDGIAQFDQ
jgi:hypothetical protein